MPYYKDPENNLHFLDSGDFDVLLPIGSLQISDADAAELQTAQPKTAPPITVSPWQFRKALNQAGLRETVENAVAVADQDTRDAYAFAPEFVENSPFVATVAEAIGKTPSEIHAFFELAQTL